MARVSTFFFFFSIPRRCCSKAFIDPRCYNNNSSLILKTVPTDVVTAEFLVGFFGSARKNKGVTKIQKSISCIFFFFFKDHASICGSGWTDKSGVGWVYIYKDCIGSPLHSTGAGLEPGFSTAFIVGGAEPMGCREKSSSEEILAHVGKKARCSLALSTSFEQSKHKLSLHPQNKSKTPCHNKRNIQSPVG